MAKVITTQNFEEEVLKSEKPFLLDFWATWCGPCMRQGPIVEELGEEGYAVGKLDVDQNMELAQQFRQKKPFEEFQEDRFVSDKAAACHNGR